MLKTIFLGACDILYLPVSESRGRVGGSSTRVSDFLLNLPLGQDIDTYYRELDASHGEVVRRTCKNPLTHWMRCLPGQRDDG